MVPTARHTGIIPCLIVAYLFAYQFYVSKTSQIEVLLFVSNATQKPIVERNHSQSVVLYFGFQCDRFSDAINWEVNGESV